MKKLLKLDAVIHAYSRAPMDLISDALLYGRLRLCPPLSEAHTSLCAIVLDPLREQDRTHSTWALREIPLGSGWIYTPLAYSIEYSIYYKLINPQ